MLGQYVANTDPLFSVSVSVFSPPVLSLSGLAGPLIFTIVWGIMMFMVNIFGVVTVKSESTKGLKIFAASLFFMGLLLFVGIGLGAQDANKTIDNKVRACCGAGQE